MSKQLPAYEILVRWSVKEVIDWLKDANLSGEFKDQFTKQCIDGNRLASLTEFDVNNFIGNKKKKQEMISYITRIKKPTNTQSKPNWIATAPPPSATNNIQYNDDSDDDSIYSWGDDFDEVDEDNGEKGASDSSEDEENYIEPTAGPPRSPAGRRKPPKIPEPEERSSRPKAKAPLLPGQGPLPPSNTGKNKGARKTSVPSTPKHRSPSPIQAVYEDPDASTPQPTKRRPPPPVPKEEEVEPPQDIYINDEQISQKHKLPEQDGGYIKFQPPVVQEQLYIEPEEPEQVPDRRAPPIPPPSQARRTTLPPVPVKNQGAASNGQDDELEALYSYNWYHSEIDRKLAEERLKEEKVNGMYLVRKSLRGGLVHPYTLMVYHGGKAYNFPIRREEDDHQFGLGKGSGVRRNGLIFPSVDKLISYFQTHPLILNPNASSGSKTMLTKPLTKL